MKNINTSTTRKKTSSPIEGYNPLNFTSIPDNFFDQYMVDLGLAELRTLLYIFRRTFGFKKFSDDISMSQMLNGIVTRDGKRLDYGTGLTKKPLLQALRNLVAKGHIIKNRNRSTRHGDESTTYRLNIAYIATPGGETPPGGRGRNSTRGRGRNSTTQDTVEQDTVHKKQNINSNRENGKKEEKRGGGFKSIRELVQRPTVIAVKGTTNNLEQTITPKDVQTAKRETVPPQKPSQTPFKAYGNEKLIATVQEISREFSDIKHERENIGQIHNIYKAIQTKGLTDSDLIDMMFRARGITREKVGSFVTSPMAYFFIVLRRQYNLPPP